MKKATERQKFLLELVRAGLMRVSGLGGKWISSRSLYYAPKGTQDPTRPEGKLLVERGWVRLEVDKNNYTENTVTKHRIYDFRAKLTPEGTTALAGK